MSVVRNETGASTDTSSSEAAAHKVSTFRMQRVRAKSPSDEEDGGALLTFETDGGRQFQFMLTLGQMDEVTDMLVSEILGY
jgi:hypothetical protein